MGIITFISSRKLTTVSSGTISLLAPTTDFGALNYGLPPIKSLSLLFIDY